MAPHQPVNGNAADSHTHGDQTTSTDEDEVTPIMTANRDRSRSYQTTTLSTHAEGSAEPSPELSSSAAKQRHPSPDSHSEAAAALTAASQPKKATGASPQPAPPSDSVRRERRKLRHSNPMRAASSSGRGADGAASADHHDDHDHDHDGSSGKLGRWWRHVVDKYGSVELDNKGSVARDHLALERTFLAWLRTSLSFASIGIAITQLFRLNTTITDRNGLQPLPDQGGDSEAGLVRLRQMGKPLGATFLGIAIIVLLVGSRRYFESQHWIIRGKFPASRGSVIFITAIAIALIVASLAIVLVVAPTQFES